MNLRGDRNFRIVQALEIHRGMIAGRLRDDLAALLQLLERACREIDIHLEAAFELLLEIFERRVDMTLVRHPLEQENDRRAGTLNRVARDAELFRDRIGGAESDSVNGPRQHVRIFLHDLERVFAVELMNPARVRRANSVAAQKYRQLAQSRGIAPRGRDPNRDHVAETAHLAHPLRHIVEDLGKVVAEMLDDPPRQRGADSSYLGCEVALDRRDACGTDGFVVEHAELLAVARMLFSASSRADAGADFDRAQLADHGDAFAHAAPDVAFDHRDRIAARFVNVEDVVERPLDRLLDILLLIHFPNDQELRAAPAG